ncbi:MAG: tetratricopeptide repeat protein, partial [Flavobacterium sp.]|nr:tetratricopeptide repeat protein [Flavobacterium sp.]
MHQKQRLVACAVFLLYTIFSFSQKEQLAQNYFERGEFEKALISYQDLIKDQPYNSLYFQKSIDCMQQLQQYDKAQMLLLDRYEKYKQPTFLIEIGYNYQLQKNTAQAKKYFDQAIDKIKKNSDEVYGIAQVFEQKSIVDYALLAYQTALKTNPKYQFNYQMAVLYGQKGDMDKMIDMFLTESLQNPINTIRIQNQLARFIADDKTSTFNDSLKKALLIKIQKTQDIFWNLYLSWYYVQVKEYGKAFVQEKAIYKRNPESFNTIVSLGEMAMDEKNTETAVEILNFVLQNTSDLDLQIQANTLLIQAKINASQPKDYFSIKEELDTLIKKLGTSPNTLQLLKISAHFAAFNLNDPEKAKNVLKNVLEMPLNTFQTAEIKMELADVFLFQEKFNQALLYYSQIQENAGNSYLAQEASLKIAKTSYFKTDFEWATHQLKILKSASTQLIANDAMDL